MKLLAQWADQPAASAVGWTILHSLWQGALIAALLGGILPLLRAPRHRYTAALMAMLALVMSAAFDLARLMPAAAAQVGSGGPRGGQLAVAAGFESALSSPAGWGAMVPWLTPIWMAGVMLLAIHNLLAWAGVARLRRRGVCRVNGHWEAAFADLSRRLGHSRPVELFESCLVDSPVALGVLRPLVLVPVGMLAGLPPAQVEAILLHELAHVRRHDYLVNLGQRVTECLFFFHPAIWWMSGVARAEREHCCDDAAVAAGGNAREFARALATLEQQRWASGREPALAATGGNLMKRVQRLLDPRSAGKAGAWTPVFGGVALMAVAAVSLSAWPAPPPQSQQQQQEATAYSRWLNEDAAHIISAEERAAFEQLSTPKEWDAFIEQFWLRRDPTPGTAQNERKEEHYRRIAYANQRFATRNGLKAGWRTDRGRIYIVYGPPDEIESHPSGKGAARPDPYEQWIYHSIEGIGTNVMVDFADRLRQGDYVQSSDPSAGK